MMETTPGYEKNPDVAWRIIDGQAVLVHNRLGEVMVLNEVGTYIWNHLDEGIDALRAGITDQYDVSEGEARLDLEQFLKELVDVGALNEGRS